MVGDEPNTTLACSIMVKGPVYVHKINVPISIVILLVYLHSHLISVPAFESSAQEQTTTPETSNSHGNRNSSHVTTQLGLHHTFKSITWGSKFCVRVTGRYVLES